MTEQSNKSRRDFLLNSAKGTIALGVGFTSLSSFVESYSPVGNPGYSFPKTGFDQQPLPYKFDALENVIDAMTMEIHYTKHAAAYSKNLKEAAATEGIASDRTVESVLAEVSKY